MAEGATVVLVGHDADAAGALLAQIAADAEIRAAAGDDTDGGDDTGAGSATATDASATTAARTGTVIGVGRAAFFRLGVPPAAGASTRPTESELDALVEFVSSQWPAR